jgi:hypothetical protein
MNLLGKKVLFLILLIVVITGLLLGYFFLQSREVKVNNLLKLVPVDASLIIETEDLTSSVSLLRKTNKLWQCLAVSEEFRDIDSQLYLIDTLIKKNFNLTQGARCNAVISFHLTGKAETGILYILQSLSPVPPDVLSEIVEKETGEPGCVMERKYEDISIYQVTSGIKTRASGLHYAIIGDVLLFSFSSIIIEDAIRQFRSPYCILDDKDFIRVQKTAGEKVDGHLYVNFREFPRFVSQFLEKKHKRNIISFINFASWGEFDIHIKPTQLLLNGFIHGNDSLGDFLHCLVEQSPYEMEFSSVLPATTGTFVALNISDFRKWRKSMGLFYEKEGTYSEFREPVESFSKNYKVSLEEVAADIFSNEVVLVYNDDPNSSFDDNHFVYVKVKSKSQARSEMLKVIAARTKTQADSLSRYINHVSVDKDFTEEVFELPVPYLARILFGNLFSRAETRYFTFIGNYMVFGNSIESLKHLHYTILLKKDLASEKSFRNVCEGLSKKSNFILYIDPRKSLEFTGWYAEKSIMTHFNNNRDNYKNISSISLQMTSSKRMLYTNVIFSWSEEVQEKTTTVWESRLDTSFSSKPWLVTNHNNDEKEIILQDDRNQLYLISASGRILWKVSLPERIISDIQQIDAYKNLKLQYVFNTRNYLIVIDRNGNYLDRFPLKLRAEASNGIAVFDYDKSRDYRIFVAGTDRKIYCYKADGTVVSGFEFDKSDNAVRQPLQHFRFGDKDFIVFCDTLKTYILDRKGNVRIKLSEYVPTGRNTRFYAETAEKNKEKIIFTDVNGHVIFVEQDGKIIRVKPGDYSPAHYFEYFDINGDGKNDFCYFDNNTFTAYNFQRNKLFEVTLPEPVIFRPALYVFPNNSRKTGFTTAKNLYLVDGKGNVHPGFPLHGQTPFSIGKLNNASGNFNLITGGHDGVLLNYEVMY